MEPELKARLGRHLLELLRESPHGLTPPTLLELAQERGTVDASQGRGPYQRILRLLAQFEAQGLIRKVGRRFVLNEKALLEASQKEAEETLAQAFAAAKLPVSPSTWIEYLKRMMGK